MAGEGFFVFTVTWLRGKGYAVSHDNKITCRHDYKNAIQVGSVDYVCPLCKELLDPLEWFFMNSFEFTEVNVLKKKSVKIYVRRQGIFEVLG